MIPGSGFETSMAEAAYALLKILLFLVGIAVVAGICTLPIFFGVLAYKVSWFWASDVTSGSRWRRGLAAVCRIGLPAFSLFATLLTLGYFGAFDWPGRLVGAVKRNKPGPMQALVKSAYDDLTRVSRSSHFAGPAARCGD